MIESVDNLEQVLEPYAGQVVWNEEDSKVYRWDPIEGWQEQSMDGTFTLSAYDMNKQIIGQLQMMDNDTINQKKREIREFVDKEHNQFYMLLCRDVNYYTVFVRDLKLADECIDDVVVECANDLGLIKSIELTEDKRAIEIWVSNSEDTYAMYFFPYDAGVIVCG
jgi:hypothetical protein